MLNTLGQSLRNTKSVQDVAAPDTDSRAIELSNMGTSVNPVFYNDHTRLTYTAPVANSQTVSFNNPVQIEERSLHYLVLDNSNNTVDKDFVFGSDYVFVDDPGNTTNTYTVLAGKKMVWYGAIILGKLYLSVSSESTN